MNSIVSNLPTTDASFGQYLEPARLSLNLDYPPVQFRVAENEYRFLQRVYLVWQHLHYPHLQIHPHLQQELVPLAEQLLQQLEQYPVPPHLRKLVESMAWSLPSGPPYLRLPDELGSSASPLMHWLLPALNLQRIRTLNYSNREWQASRFPWHWNVYMVAPAWEKNMVWCRYWSEQIIADCITHDNYSQNLAVHPEYIHQQVAVRMSYSTHLPDWHTLLSHLYFSVDGQYPYASLYQAYRTGELEL